MWSRLVHCFTAVVMFSNSNTVLSSVMLNSLHFEPSMYKVSLHKLLLVLQWILFHIWLPITKFLFVSWQVSYSLLARVSPVTHSVTNSLKRVVVIVSSVLFFRTPLLPCLRHVTLKLMLCFMHVPITHHLIYLYLNCIFVLACRNWYCSCLSLIRAAFFPQAVWSNLILSLKPPY